MWNKGASSYYVTVFARDHLSARNFYWLLIKWSQWHPFKKHFEIVYILKGRQLYKIWSIVKLNIISPPFSPKPGFDILLWKFLPPCYQVTFSRRPLSLLSPPLQSKHGNTNQYHKSLKLRNLRNIVSRHKAPAKFENKLCEASDIRSPAWICVAIFIHRLWIVSNVNVSNIPLWNTPFLFTNKSINN